MILLEARRVGVVVAILPLAGAERAFRQALSHENEGALHVHGGCDELKMAGVAGEPAIADAAHAVPLLHRGVGAFDAAADALRPAVELALPGLERISLMLDLPEDAVADPATAQALAESLAAEARSANTACSSP